MKCCEGPAAASTTHPLSEVRETKQQMLARMEGTGSGSGVRGSKRVTIGGI